MYNRLKTQKAIINLNSIYLRLSLKPTKTGANLNVFSTVGINGF